VYCAGKYPSEVSNQGIQPINPPESNQSTPRNPTNQPHGIQPINPMESNQSTPRNPTNQPQGIQPINPKESNQSTPRNPTKVSNLPQKIITIKNTKLKHYLP